MTYVLALAALAVGFSIGVIGTGGIFLLPVLAFVVGLPVETAIGTALVSFVFTGVVATLFYARRGRIDWPVAGWISLGSAIAGPFGARLSVALPGSVVKCMLAAFLIAVGFITLLRPQRHDVQPVLRHPAMLAVYGAFVGFGAGLTGVGGPAILVPLLMIVGFPAGAAVAASQPNAIVASFAGAAGHALFGRIDWPLALFVSAFQVTGAIAGSEVGSRLNVARLRSLAALASIIAGVWTAVRTLLPAQ